MLKIVSSVPTKLELGLFEEDGVKSGKSLGTMGSECIPSGMEYLPEL